MVLLAAFMLFGSVGAFASKGVIKPTETFAKSVNENLAFDVIQLEKVGNNETETVKETRKFQLSIQASCGTFTFQYTCPGCNFSDIQHDIEILSAWSELTCMIFF